jgi:5-methylthioadenosine/S-adenosylhomocysteine deaminase
MLELGVAVSLGSDSAMSGNFLDAVRQTFLCVGGFHETRLDPKIISPETAVEMITVNGARCMLWDKELGSLEAGKKADVTLLDIQRPEWQPVYKAAARTRCWSTGRCSCAAARC